MVFLEHENQNVASVPPDSRKKWVQNYTVAEKELGGMDSTHYPNSPKPKLLLDLGGLGLNS